MDDHEYEIGGPLAGVKLPSFPTGPGEEPGHPGCFPGTEFHTPNQHPDYELSPGSVEHWRSCRPNFFPDRPFYDRQSQLKNWAAPDLPDIGPAHLEDYAEPIYWPQEWILQHYVAPAIPNEPGEGRNRAGGESLRYLPLHTGRHRAPVPVVRCFAGGPQIVLPLGQLEAGLYVVRVIGAVETKEIRPFRKPLFLKATVNDGNEGESSTYRQRLGYCDEFYDVADIYFRAQEAREYGITLQIDSGSEVDLLIHNISLDDVLAGCVRRPIKTRPIHATKDGVTPQSPTLSSDERLARDALIWQGFAPLNVQLARFHASGPDGIPGVEPGTGDLTPAEIEEAHGAWRHSQELDVLMRNDELGLEYSIDDLCAGRPLPEPYPLRDDGTGLTFPSEDEPHVGRVWAPIGEALGARIGSYYHGFTTAAQAWTEEGNSDLARDGALKLIRFAYSFPAFEDISSLNAVIHEPSAYGRGDRCRRRETGGAQFIGHFGFHFSLADSYDRLFSYIKGNEELAQSVSRFVPSVRSAKDVIELLDVYLIQTLAKRFMRYHYWGDGRQPAYLAEVAAILGDNEVTRPWLEWMFRRAFYYPGPTAGLPEYMVTALDRDGRSPIGSSSYVFGDRPAAVLAETLDLYVANGGDSAFSLSDPRRFPKIIASLYFAIRSRAAGLWVMRMGNVSGPDKDYRKAFEAMLDQHAARGWRMTRDPAFAFILKHYGSTDAWSPEERQEIETAAQSVRRAPWMENRSRVLPGYAAFLESGIQHDDYRFRRSVMLRVGTGSGHTHLDTLDLQIHAQGLPATIEAGQRPGYSVPGDRHTRLHNTVEVSGRDWAADHADDTVQWDHLGGTNSWVRTLSDTEGARYISADVAANSLCRFARRQVALIDVDEGMGSERLGPEAYGPTPAGLPKQVTTPNSYVVDVFRVSGGHTHTYCFHSHIADPDLGDPQPRMNALEVRHLDGGPQESARDKAAAAYLEEFSGERYHGTAPEHFEATFALQKERKRDGEGRRFGEAGTESYLLKSLYDPESPDKFTRLHVLGAEGALVMRGDLNCMRWDYQIPNIFVQRRGEELETAFVAVIEPYAGEPFIKGIQRLAVEHNDDAHQAVAVLVETTNGHRDVCFADGRPERTRRIGSRQVAAEYAYYSTDTEGLRQVALIGASFLKSPEVEIRAACPERLAKIVEVDYVAKTVWIDEVWPVGTEPRQVEVLTQPADDPLSWRTSFTAVSIQPEGDRTRITFLRSADQYRSRVVSVDEVTGTVTGVLPLSVNCGDFRRGWTATDEAQKRRWRVSSVEGRAFTLTGGPVSAALFEPDGVLRLWEYGVGDQLRLSTQVDLRRTSGGEFELAADVDTEVTFPDGATHVVPAGDVSSYQRLT